GSPHQAQRFPFRSQRTASPRRPASATNHSRNSSSTESNPCRENPPRLGSRPTAAIAESNSVAVLIAPPPPHQHNHPPHTAPTSSAPHRPPHRRVGGGPRR